MRTIVTPPPRRFAAAARHLRTDPQATAELAAQLDDTALAELGAAIQHEQRCRALASGDRAAVIAMAFEHGFGRDGLAHDPWIEAAFVVCPGGLVGKNRGNHRCRFVSVRGTWIWDSIELLHEEKRSTPGADDGFRAIALLPILEGLELDVVRGRMRSGQHAVEHVLSLEVRRGALLEVGQRKISAHGLV